MPLTDPNQKVVNLFQISSIVVRLCASSVICPIIAAEQSDPPTKSDQLAPVAPETVLFVSPAPVKTGLSVAKRVDSFSITTSEAVIPLILSDCPDDEEIRSFPGFIQPLTPIAPGSPPAERSALASAVRDWIARKTSDDFSALEEFVNENPTSPWTPSLELNLGRLYYHGGYFSKAMAAYKNVWEKNRNLSDALAILVADSAGVEYAMMSARVGKMDDLKGLLAEMDTRMLSDGNLVNVERAREGLWKMTNRPEVSFRCGPYALDRIHGMTGRATPSGFLDKTRSPREGFSLSELKRMATEDLKMPMRMARRAAGAKLVLPCVAHWRIGHYGALIREQDGAVHLKDPTFGNDTWMTLAAIDQEASGYFLVPSGDLPEGWTEVTDREAAGIFGRGHSGDSDGSETSPCSKQSGGSGGCGKGMAEYSFHTMLTGLRVYDTPIGYSTAVGPSVEVMVNYNMKEELIPGSILYTNFSPMWECSWVSYLIDDPALPAANITVHLPGGGAETHTGYDPASQSFTTNRRWSSKLVRTAPNTYERRNPDGSKEVYGRAIGTSWPRKVFLTQVVDPQGNAVTISFDNTPTYESRILKLVDAAGLETNFAYDVPGNGFLVSSITDPFGRTAAFAYETVAGILKLRKITDTIGIQSSFEYNGSGQVNALVTPYGRTTFAFGAPNVTSGLIRWIEANDPNGDKEKIEYHLGGTVTGIPFALPLVEVPYVRDYGFYRLDMDDRNSFYWDKKAWASAPGDYSKAHIFHWLQVDGVDVASGILESEKKAFESRIWYLYPGQGTPRDLGTSPFPLIVARIIEDGLGSTTTAYQKFIHNEVGNLRIVTDEMGRETVTEYAGNHIDVNFVKQKTGGGYETLLSSTFDLADPPHCPKTITDTSGKTSTLTYTTAGQPLTVTNALQETTTITYDPVTKRPTQITGPVAGATVAFAYDGFERVRQVTDSAGHTTTYDYDNFDRVTLITYPDLTTEQFVYHRLNLHAQKDRENRWTRTWHNSLKQPFLQQDPLGRQTIFEWCKCGDLKSFKDAKNQLTSWKHDAQGRITEKLYPDGRKEIPTYEPLSGRLSTMTDPLLQVKTFAYFLDGNPRSITHSNLAAGTAATPNTAYTFHPHFSRVSTITRGTETTTLGYHPVGQLGALRLASIDGHFAGTSDLLAFTYDALGRMKTRNVGASGTDHQTTWNFDALGRLDNLVNNLGTFQNAYVAQTERLQEILYPNGQKTTFGYFPASGDHRLQTLHHFANATDTLSRFDYTYTPSGNIATWQRQFGSAAASKFTLGYSRADELTSAVLADVANPATILKSYGYQYDPAGNRTSAQDGNTLGSANHDNANRLATIAGGGKLRVEGSTDEPAKVKVNGTDAKIGPGNHYEAWVDADPGPNTLTVQATDYSPIGYTATKSWSVNITGAPARTFAHDANGNMTSDGTRSYEWDADNRLVKITWGAGSNKSTEFRYNPLGQRSERIEKTGTSETAHFYYLYDGIRFLCRYTGGTAAANIDRRYFGEGEQRKNGSLWDSFYYCRDHLGSVREVMNSNGTLAARYDYDPYGKRSMQYQAATYADGCDIGYTGHITQTSPVPLQTEVVLTLFRAYDPELGRWLSADPIKEDGGINLYSYAYLNPIGLNDLLGLTPADPTRKHFPHGGSGGGGGGGGGPTLGRLGGGGLGFGSFGRCPPPKAAPAPVPARPVRITNRKHHQNSSSPEPKNVEEIWKKAIFDSKKNTWYSIDKEGVIHRFSPPSNGQTHWNGSTNTPSGLTGNQLPSNEILKQLKNCGP